MYEKILSQLAIKFPGVNKKFLGLWAKKLEPKVTEETEIQGVVDELDNLPVSIPDLATEFQKEGDSRVTEAKKKWQKPTQKPHKTEEPDDDPQPPADDMPAWAKSLMTTVQGLAAEKKQNTIKGQIAEKLKGKVSEKYWSRMALPDSEDQLDEFISGVEKDWEELQQENADKGLGVRPPGGSGTPANLSAKAVEADIDSWAAAKSAKKES